jgi:hypothetical protein
MPKPLTRTPPSSSVAGILEQGITSQLIARPEARSATIVPMPVSHQVSPEEGDSGQIQASGEVAGIHRQFALTPSTDRTLKRLIAAYGEATGLDLKHSQLLRAILVAVAYAMPELTREATHIGRLRRPKNDRGSESLRDGLERRIAAAFVSGMRAAGVMPH